MRLNDYDDDPAIWILKWTVTIVLITAVLLTLTWALRMTFYPAQQAGRIMERTLDADNVIYNYEYFHRAYNDILAMDNRLIIAERALEDFRQSNGPRENWDFRQRQEESRLLANYTGAQQVRQQMIAQYNSRSNMANRSIFRGTSLPERIEP